MSFYSFMNLLCSACYIAYLNFLSRSSFLFFNSYILSSFLDFKASSFFYSLSNNFSLLFYCLNTYSFNIDSFLFIVSLRPFSALNLIYLSLQSFLSYSYFCSSSFCLSFMISFYYFSFWLNSLYLLFINKSFQWRVLISTNLQPLIKGNIYLFQLVLFLLLEFLLDRHEPLLGVVLSFQILFYF